MLVCPTCSYRNSGDPRFCYQCGTPLHCKICPGCRTQVNFREPNCPQCQASVGTIRQGIIVYPSAFELEDSDSDCTAPMTEAIPQVGDCLDGEQQRYSIREVCSSHPDYWDEISCRVLDGDPFRVPYLEAELKEEDTLPLQVTAEATQWQRLVRPYQILALQFHRTVPKLYDAWQENGKIILLLEDRSQLTHLDELDERQVPPEQVLQWLGEMTELWGALLSCRCGSSLLELGNLRVDEHQELCLERLYLENENSPPTLVDLAGRWKQLFQASKIAGWQPWMDLLADMMGGSITEVSQLRSRLQKLAYDLDGLAATKTPANVPTATPSEETEPTVTFSEADEEDESSTMAFPKQLLAIEEAGYTNTGRQRRHNEDTFAIWTRSDRQMLPTGNTLSVRGLYILCDGMGGHEGGEVASAIAVKTLTDYFQKHWVQTDLPDGDTIKQGIYLANQAIFQENKNQSRGGTRRMGTTLVMALLQNTQVAIAHVGDSRLYAFDRQNQLQQLTTDHEVGQRRIQRGISPEIAYSSPDAYQLTQAIGPYDTEFLSPSVQYIELEKDTLLLLASDGLTDNQFVETQATKNLDEMLAWEANLTQQVRTLVACANDHNGHDNLSAIAIRTKIGASPT